MTIAARTVSLDFDRPLGEYYPLEITFAVGRATATVPPRREDAMPKVATLPGGVRICQYYKDHDPPHFHHEHAGVIALIRIADMTVFQGQISPSDRATVKSWGYRHQAELALNWVLMKANLAPNRIAYP
jgi:hypothetical protein